MTLFLDIPLLGTSLDMECPLSVVAHDTAFHATSSRMSWLEEHGQMDISGWVVFSTIFGILVVIFTIAFSSRASFFEQVFPGLIAGFILLLPIAFLISRMIWRKRRVLNLTEDLVHVLAVGEPLPYHSPRIRSIDENETHLVFLVDDLQGHRVSRFSVAKNGIETFYVYRILGKFFRVVLCSGSAEFSFDMMDQNEALFSLKGLAHNCGMLSFNAFRPSEVMTEIKWVRFHTEPHLFLKNNTTFEEIVALTESAVPSQPPSHIFPRLRVRHSDWYDLVSYVPSQRLILRRPLARFFTGFAFVLQFFLVFLFVIMANENETINLIYPIFVSFFLWGSWFFLAMAWEISIEKSLGRIVKKRGPITYKTIALDGITSLQVKIFKRTQRIKVGERRGDLCIFYEAQVEIKGVIDDKIFSAFGKTQEEAYANANNFLYALHGMLGERVSIGRLDLME